MLIHTGGVSYFCDLIGAGYVDVLLAGNALAVHDVEHALFGTSLGVDLETGKAIEGGHRHHMRAINTICRVGGLRQAVEQGVLKTGVMYECIRHNVPFVLAGSIRDDGPLPETMMDLIEAQDRYAAALEDVKLVLVLSTMLHGIGVGNMLPSWVRMVCVDINPAVVTKLADRGSSQTLGIVTDVGLFVHQLHRRLVSRVGAVHRVHQQRRRAPVASGLRRLRVAGQRQHLRLPLRGRRQARSAAKRAAVLLRGRERRRRSRDRPQLCRSIRFPTRRSRSRTGSRAARRATARPAAIDTC